MYVSARVVGPKQAIASTKTFPGTERVAPFLNICFTVTECNLF